MRVLCTYAVIALNGCIRIKLDRLNKQINKTTNFVNKIQDNIRQFVC